MSNNTIIRQVEKKDNSALSEMIKCVFEEHDAPLTGTVYSDASTNYLYNVFQQPKSILWVVEMNGSVLGCCGVFPTDGLPDGHAELVKFYLSKDIRGLGIGKQLMEQSIISATELGYKKLYIESFPQFSKAVRIYEKIGFRKINHALGNSGHTACDIWMVKELEQINV